MENNPGAVRGYTETDRPNFTFREPPCSFYSGSKGLAEISKPNLQRLRFVPISDRAPSGPIIAPPDEISEHPGFDMLNAELTAFARAIREAKPYPIPLDEVLHGMSVFDAIVEAARSDTIVAVAG